MEEQFILRVPPAVAERIERLLNDSSGSSEDKNLDMVFSEDGRTGTFVIGNDRLSSSLLDLPSVVESYKTYDDNVLIKTADIGQMIMVREESDGVPEAVEYRHGLTPPMRDARRRRFRREPDLNPEVVRRVERDLQNIMAGGTAENIGVEMIEPGEYGDEAARSASKKVASAPLAKPDAPGAGTAGGEPDGSDTDETDDSM
ncbi:transcription initiation factor TFIID subunit 7-like [Salvia splendens]|uniref:transcription initiation factor TFIID subunit 7-like n=1 Tax=Salvia splendens TaxID=180675 RepID=UPI001C25F930|nr:transcription initiation factor TFIID subunit 7-like [Salvia splendens]